MGNRSFVKHGFLSPTCWDILKQTERASDSWGVNRDEWNKKGKEAQEVVLAIWGPVDKEEQKKWQGNIEKWGPVPLTRTYTTYFDPQA